MSEKHSETCFSQRYVAGDRRVSRHFISMFFYRLVKLIEVMFSLNGPLLGYEATVSRDYPVMFGTLLYIFTLIGLLPNILSDISYTLVDPMHWILRTIMPRLSPVNSRPAGRVSAIIAGATGHYGFFLGSCSA